MLYLFVYIFRRRLIEAAYFRRHGCLHRWLKTFEEGEGGIDAFTKGYEYYGIQIRPDNSVVAREWAPGAIGLYLTGDFSEFIVSTH